MKKIIDSEKSIMKKIIVVGATSGIGRELALQLAAKNYLVGVTGRRMDKLESLQAEWPGNIIISAFDNTDTTEAIKKLEDLAAQLGELDVIILSSGIGTINLDLEFEIEKQIIDLNVTGFTAIADWAFTFFTNQKHGQLAAISSIAGLRGNHESPAYFSSKAYQINYLEGLRQKAKKTNAPIYITDIRPGFVTTDLIVSHMRFWVSTVEKASKQIIFAIENRKKVAYITKRWGIAAAALKLMPRVIHQYL